MKKKTLLTFVLLCIGIFMFSVGVSAETDGSCGDKLVWTLNAKGTLTINGTGEMANWDFNVTNMPWYSVRDSIKSVVIENGATSIGTAAFYDCKNLAAVTIPSSIKTICNYAFYDCSALKSITIPNGVASVGDKAFYRCSVLQSIIIPDSVKTVGEGAFYLCQALQSVKISSGMTAISAYTFGDCHNLQSVIIPDSIKTIGNYAFMYCNLKNTTIPEGVTTVGNYAFFGCTGLNVTIPSSLKTIGRSAFGNCGLTSVTIPNGVKTISDSAFYCCYALQSVTIPDSVETIGVNAFSECDVLQSITIPNSVKTIGEGAFKACKSLTTVEIPSSVTTISKKMFYGCGSLTSISLPDGIETIGDSAFYDCESLTAAVIPGSVTGIGENAFRFSPLKVIFYIGSEDEWEDVSIHSVNVALSEADIIFNATRKTYKFETNCNEKLANITDYAVVTKPKLVNEDKSLEWYDNEELTGSQISFPYYGASTTLYANWIDKTGLSFDEAITVKANKQYNVTITEDGQTVYYKFVPEFEGIYKFYSTGSSDTCGNLYNGNKELKYPINDGGDETNFEKSYYLTAGETYYIAVGIVSGTGSFTLITETDCGVKRTETECVTATTGEKIFISAPMYMPENTVITLVCYKNNALTEVLSATYKGQVLFFIAKKELDSAKVMAWSGLDSMIPVCEAEIVKLN